MRENLAIRPQPDQSSAPVIMDYTTAPVGLRLRGHIWTGQETTYTAACTKCGRTGVASVLQEDKQIVVHRGRIVGDRLEGIDYCEFSNSIPLPPRRDPQLKGHEGSMEDAANVEGKEFSTFRTSKVVAIIDEQTQVDTVYAALTSAGFTNEMIEVFCGLEGEHEARPYRRVARLPAAHKAQMAAHDANAGPAHGSLRASITGGALRHRSSYGSQ